MPELAPGVFIEPLLRAGTAYIMDMRDLGMLDFGENGRAVIVPEVDWERIDPAERERILDEMTSRSAEDGIGRLYAWLVTKMELR